MRFHLVPVLAAALLAAGCVEQPESEIAAATTPDVPGLAVEPVVQTFVGHMTSSFTGGLAHQDPETEMLFADVQREGFILEVVGVPETLQIDLEWTATSPGARMFSMVNVPTSTEGEVLDVLSDRTDTGSVCMRVPLDEIQPGLLSVMAHSINAVNVDYEVRVTTVGGEVVLHADRGHTEVEREAGAARDPLPCADNADA